MCGRKGITVTWAVIVAIVIYGVCYNRISELPPNGDFATLGSSTDISKITNGSLLTNMIDDETLDEQVGSIYRSLKEDNSERALRIIGKIGNADISAKDMELRALKCQLYGSENPYLQAWNDMEIEEQEKKLAVQFNIVIKEDVMSSLEQLKSEVLGDDVIRTDLESRLQAYGLTLEEYWDLWMDMNEKSIRHDRVL